MKTMDLFSDALWDFFVYGKDDMHVERDDGLVRREDISWFFTTYRDFLTIEKNALKFARGRVLDVGCGAGRHSLYLQQKGFKVTALDVLLSIVELALVRGARDVRVGDATRSLNFRDGEYDTIVLFGNNIGIAGTPKKLERMLREYHRITSKRGRVLATTVMPSTTKPNHRAYAQRNVERGRYPGQIRMRLVRGEQQGEWMDWLIMSPTDLMQVASKAGWKVAQVFPLDSFESGYSVVLEKK
jgi:SAM-dependent methyltransferase